MSLPTKSERLAYDVAGTLFDRLRARGIAPGLAMRQAASVLRAHRRQDLLTNRRRRRLDAEEMDTITEVLASRKVTLADICTRRRYPNLIEARSEAVFVVRAIGGGLPSFPDLAAYFGVDHSTLVTADQRFLARMRRDEVLAARVNRWVPREENRQTSLNLEREKPWPNSATSSSG